MNISWYVGDTTNEATVNLPATNTTSQTKEELLHRLAQAQEKLAKLQQQNANNREHSNRAESTHTAPDLEEDTVATATNSSDNKHRKYTGHVRVLNDSKTATKSSTKLERESMTTALSQSCCVGNSCKKDDFSVNEVKRIRENFRGLSEAAINLKLKELLRCMLAEEAGVGVWKIGGKLFCLKCGTKSVCPLRYARLIGVSYNKLAGVVDNLDSTLATPPTIPREVVHKTTKIDKCKILLAERFATQAVTKWKRVSDTNTQETRVIYGYNNIAKYYFDLIEEKIKIEGEVFTISEDYFRKVWVEHFPDVIVSGEKPVCGRCATLHLAIKTGTEGDKLIAHQQLKEHLQHAECERDYSMQKQKVS